MQTSVLNRHKETKRLLKEYADLKSEIFKWKDDDDGMHDYVEDCKWNARLIRAELRQRCDEFIGLLDEENFWNVKNAYKKLIEG